MYQYIVESIDYRSIESTDQIFNVGINIVCINIVIFNDNLLENNESFVISLSSLTEGVSILTGSSTVEITDDDGECLISLSQKMVYEIFTFLQTEVTVNWQQNDYPVDEGDVVRVCAQALQITAREFVVNIVAPVSEGI